MIEGLQLHVLFWTNAALESYFFVKSWKSDPGYIKISPSQQKKVFKLSFANFIDILIP